MERNKQIAPANDRQEEHRNSGNRAGLEVVVNLARRIEQLHFEAIQLCEPRVYHLIQSGCRDVTQIEHTLDELLDHCAHEKGLLLFRTLCRFYYELDPHAAVAYVNIYRELWDSELTKGE